MNNEVARDLIELVNGMNDFVKSKSVKYGQTNFEYVPLDDILERVKTNTKWAVQQPLSHDNGVPTIETVLTHESGEIIRSGQFPLIFASNKPQDMGSVITYMKRYQLGSFLGLATETDNDANTESEVKDLLITDETLSKLSMILTDDDITKIKAYYKIGGIAKLTEKVAQQILAKKGKK